MTQFGSSCRAILVAGLLAAAGGMTPAANAAQADVDLLKTYVGAWKGRGVLTGKNTETVVCKLTLSEGNEQKINYKGRCTLAGSNLSISGTMAYIDASQRYEAIMTSNADFTGVAVGRRQDGGGILFNLKERDTAEGEDRTITADILLQAGSINVAFHVVDAKTGETVRAAIPFEK